MHIVLIIHYYWLLLVSSVFDKVIFTTVCVYIYTHIYRGYYLWFKASTEGPGVYTMSIKEETLSKHYEFQTPKAQRTGRGGD